MNTHQLRGKAASIHNVLNQELHLTPSTAFKLEHEAELAEWNSTLPEHCIFGKFCY